MTDRIFNFDDYYLKQAKLFRQTPALMTGEWQSQDISDKPMLATRELVNQSFIMAMPEWPKTAEAISPNLPWAEDHIQERVGGEPLNPPPSSEWWPFAQQGHAEHTDGGQFSHTYPERMWPKNAGSGGDGIRGIRYAYGDLADVVKQLQRGRYTRQAFLPIWFPEDTGANEGQRVPCTLGYHFMIRPSKSGDKLQITYYIRSCDFMRHFRDDVYMAIRLAQWVTDALDGVGLGDFVMHIVSLHIFEGDMPMLNQKIKELSMKQMNRLGSAF